jgi:acyl-CoA synthetase (AMP-forming)/AMP-acid ligase II
VPNGIDSANLKTPLAALFSRTRKSSALIAGGQSWSAEQLTQQAELLSSSLRDKGVERDECVALHMLNIPELVVAYCACFRIGAIAVPLNARYKQAEIESMIERTRPVLYLGHAALYANVIDIDTHLLPLSARYVVGLENGDDTAVPWTDLMRIESSTEGRNYPRRIEHLAG